MEKCRKCRTDCKKKGCHITEGGEVFYFCLLCATLINQLSGANRVHQFIDDEKLDCINTGIPKAMVLARMKRSKGESPWNQEDLQ